MKSRTLIQLFVLLSLCYFIFFFRIGVRDLWSPDEPRYAQVAREMLETKEWIVPQLNGQLYREKPPLYFWLVAMVSEPFGGVTEATARFPSALAATATVVLTYFLGIMLLSKRKAFFGALILMTSAQFVWIGRLGVMDGLLTLWTTAALATFYFAYIRKRPLISIAGFVFVGLAVLSKGPVGLAIPLIVMLAFLMGDIFLHKQDSPRQLGWFVLCAIVGLAVVALIVGPWWEAVYERSGGRYGSLSHLLKQTQGRMLDSYSHQKPFYHYISSILWQFLPWTVFFPLAIHGIRKKAILRDDSGLRFLVFWFLSTFIFFTLISGKRSQYLMPLVPAGGLILGWALAAADPERGTLRERRQFLIPLAVLGALVIAGLVGVTVATYVYAQEYFSLVLGGVAVLVVVLIILGRYLLNQPPLLALTLVGLITTITVVTTFGYAAQIVDRYNSARPFCNTVLAAMEPDDRLFFYRSYRPNVHFYMHRLMPRLKTQEDIEKELENVPRIFLVLESRNEGKFDLDSAYQVEEIAQAQVGSRDLFCVMVRRPEPARRTPGEHIDSP